jgi:hypothetical protein
MEPRSKEQISEAGWEYARTFYDRYKRRIPFDGLDIACAYIDGLEARLPIQAKLLDAQAEAALSAILSWVDKHDELVVRRIWDDARRAALSAKPEPSHDSVASPVKD